MADAGSVALQNRGPDVLTVTIIMLCLSTVSVALRLISRIGVVKRVSNDDYFIMIAWLIAFGFSFSICYGTSVGLGRHEEDVLAEWMTPLRKAQYAFSVLYNPALMATKTSICLFYLTLAKNQQIFRWTTISTLVVVNVAGLALTFLNIFQCRPIGAAFMASPNANAHCIDIVALYLSSAPVNIVTDLALLFLPMPILTGMKLPRNEKIILVATFSFGAFVAVVDVIRIAYLESAALARLQNKGDIQQHGDYSWIASLSFMWSAVEVNIGIVCASVPGVKPLAAKVFPSLLGQIKKAGDRTSSAFYGPGDAQWSSAASKSRPTSRSIPKPPTSPTFSNHHASMQSAPWSTASNRVKDDELGIDPASKSTDVEPGPDMNMMDFLTTPDTAHVTLPAQDTQMEKPSTATGKSRKPSLTVFDFVNTKDPRCMTKLSNRESIFPIMLVTILFFLWGFAYGLLDILNQQFQLVVGISQSQAIGLHAAYYGAYLIGPLTYGHFVFKKWGFRSTFIVGLCIYGTGTLVFWPSAVLASFPAFLISNFIIGLGVSTLETAGNPFITLCGPPEHAEVRLNISQGVQAVGTVVSPILAKKVFFKSVDDAPSLIDVQWAYLGIALFVVILALVFYYLPIPEASDQELAELSLKTSSFHVRKGHRLPVIYMTLFLGAFSNFCYVGGQEAVASFYEEFISNVAPHSPVSPFNYHAVGHTVFALGRFLTAFLGIYLPPRRILLFLYIGCIVTTALSTNLTGSAGISMIVLTLLFESGIFSLIFAISLRGLGTKSKLGAVILTAATSGGAVMPAIMRVVTTADGVRYAFVVVTAVFAFGCVFPLYLELVPAARRQVDPKGSRYDDVAAAAAAHLSNQQLQQPRPDTSSSTNRASRVFGNVMSFRKAWKAGGSQASHSTDADTADVEHVEKATAEAQRQPHSAATNSLSEKREEEGEGRGMGAGHGGGLAGRATVDSTAETNQGKNMHLAPWPD